MDGRAEPVDERTWDDLRLVLDEELSQLPEKYRAPVVLCYFEGKTNEQAARELGCPKSSLSWRLGRARELLRERLVRRGITLSAGTLAAVLLGQTATAASPALLVICHSQGGNPVRGGRRRSRFRRGCDPDERSDEDHVSDQAQDRDRGRARGGFARRLGARHAPGARRGGCRGAIVTRGRRPG